MRRIDLEGREEELFADENKISLELKGGVVKAEVPVFPLIKWRGTEHIEGVFVNAPNKLMNPETAELVAHKPNGETIEVPLKIENRTATVGGDVKKVRQEFTAVGKNNTGQLLYGEFKSTSEHLRIYPQYQQQEIPAGARFEVKGIGTREGVHTFNSSYTKVDSEEELRLERDGFTLTEGIVPIREDGKGELIF